MSTKIAKSAPHIHERCTKADGKSISDALKVTYSHHRYPDDVYTYLMKDIKYDYGKGWIYLESPSRLPSSGGTLEIEFSTDGTDDSNTNNNNNEENSGESEVTPPRTPLSTAETPMRGHAYNLRSRSAGTTPSTSNSGVNNSTTYLHRYPTRNRPAMPDILLENDNIHAMLERGTLLRDFAQSMQALGFGDEPAIHTKRPG